MIRTATAQSRSRTDRCSLDLDRQALTLTRLFTRGGRALLTLMALIPVACSSLPVTGPPTAPPIGSYVVGAPDLLLVNILPDPQIIREVRVRPDGMISIDLVGDVQATGHTPGQIAQTIQREIRRFKRDAEVNVALVSSSSQYVTIYGEVGAPGVFALSSQTRIAEAIGRVGGPKPFASLNGVRIVRPHRSGADMIGVRLGDIQKGDLSTNFVLAGGDLIVVPPTFLARIGYAMQMIFFPFQPAIGALASTGQAIQGYNAISP